MFDGLSSGTCDSRDGGCKVREGEEWWSTYNV